MNGGMMRVVAVAAVMAGFGLYAAPASAQATRTWVSGTGDDANPCSRTAPCKTFAGSIGKTATGGEINCLDPAGFGTITITKSISIVCNNVVAGVVASGTSGIVINAAGAVVTLSGLDIDGANSTGTNGIQVVDAGTVIVDNVVVRNFNGYGLRYEPASGGASLVVRRSLLTGNGSGSSVVSGGMYIHPTTSASVTVADTQLANNVNDGIRLETASGTSINATIVQSVVSGNGTGLRFRLPAGTINAAINGVTLANNTASGLVGNGAGLVAAVGDTTITGSATGVSAAGGATVTSFGDNRLSGNTTNGSFSGTQAKQ